MPSDPKQAPSVISLTDWSVSLDEPGVHQIRIVLSDPAEARAWALWMFDRCDDADKPRGR